MNIAWTGTKVRARFPGGAVRRVVLLQYGDDPEIEPGDLWVRVLLDAARPEDYERSQKAFVNTHQAAIEQFPSYLAEKLREIIQVEFTFSDNPVTRGGHDGPRYGLPTGQRLSDYQEWEHGEDTFELTRLGPAGLETVDTLIMASLAATRAEAIRWALDRLFPRLLTDTCRSHGDQAAGQFHLQRNNQPPFSECRHSGLGHGPTT